MTSLELFPLAIFIVDYASKLLVNKFRIVEDNKKLQANTFVVFSEKVVKKRWPVGGSNP